MQIIFQVLAESRFRGQSGHRENNLDLNKDSTKVKKRRTNSYPLLHFGMDSSFLSAPLKMEGAFCNG